MIRQLAVLILCTFVMLFKFALASSSTMVTINNSNIYPVTISRSSDSNGCVDSSISALPMTIQPGGSGSFSYDDDNSGGCMNSEKLLVLSVQGASTASSNSSMDVYISHVKVNSSFNSIVSQATNQGVMYLSNATCSSTGGSCMNTLFPISGNYVLNLSIGGGGSNGSVGSFTGTLLSAGLGTISVTNGAGQPLVNNGGNNSSGNDNSNDNSNGTFVNTSSAFTINFSKTTQACTFSGVFLKCDPGINYYYDSGSQSYVFVCQQTTSGNNGQCPWLLTSGSTSSTFSSAPNIY